MSTRNLTLLIILGVILVLGGCVGCGTISLQKKAVQLDEGVKGALGKMQSQYQRRSDLIPNLVSVVKGAANFETETLTKVVEARAKATSVNINANDLTPDKVAQFQQAQGQLTSSLSKLLAVVENYPDLKANQNFVGLQAELAGTENRINTARNDFNKAVQEYNSTIRQFPNNIYSGWFGYKDKPYFEAQPGSDQAPKIDPNAFK